MRTSLFDLFKIGIGPSSSHTVGPMRAALCFTEDLAKAGLLERTARVVCDLYGSLALTGHGHGTDRAVLLGLLGEKPAEIDPAGIDNKLAVIRSGKKLRLGGRRDMAFDESADLLFHREIMFPPEEPDTQHEDPARHPNGMRFRAFDSSGNVLLSQIYYSIGDRKSVV